MLINRILTSKVISRRFVPSETTRHQFHTSIKLLLASSKDSSDSSSDLSADSSSDSDNEPRKLESKSIQDLKPQTRTTNLNQLKSLINEAKKKTEPRINVAIPPKPPRPERKLEADDTEESKFEKKFLNAARNVAEKIGGDVKRTESELLSRLLKSKKGEEKEHEFSNQSDILKDMKVKGIMTSQETRVERVRKVSQKIDNFEVREKRWKSSNNVMPLKTENSSPLKESTISKLLNQKQSEEKESANHDQRRKSSENVKPLEKENSSYFREDSTIYKLLKQRKRWRPSEKNERYVEGNSNNFVRRKSSMYSLLKQEERVFGIFTERETTETKDQGLSTWELLEKRELKLLDYRPPQNYFEEMIQWTEQGKVWHFPINNEQGMEKEKQVHFTEHVFMERHLKDWCPRRGPVRHFMELVCIGLSKNAFMTVDEKIDHIMWYKDYLGDKRDLLKEIGGFDDESPSLLPKPSEKVYIGPMTRT